VFTRDRSLTWAATSSPGSLSPAVDTHSTGLEVGLRPSVGRRFDTRFRFPAEGHEGGVLRVSNLHEREEIEVVVREPVEVLEEQLQLLVRQPLTVPLVSHDVTIRAEGLRHEAALSR
jgi:hypothetical protein